MLIETSKLRTSPNNPRAIRDDKMEQLMRSIQEDPELVHARPLIVNQRFEVIAGNQRLRACIALGWEKVPIVQVNWDEAKQKRAMIKDNVSAGEWDWDMLANEWEAEELNEWGLEVPLEEEPVEGLTDDDDVPEVPEEPTTKTGDLWILGDHRLLCGDSTKAEDVERLMNGEKADVGFTSPPYALGKSAWLSGNKANKARGNAYQAHDDNAQDWARLMTGWYNAFDDHVEAWCVNVQPLAGNKRDLFEWIAENTSRLVDVAIWAKDNAAPQMAKNVLTSQYEFLIFLGKEGASRAIPFANFQGNQSALYKGGANHENVAPQLHGAAMPSHLPQWVLGELFSQATSVVDPFAGTGTTLIVAEQFEGKSYNMELDPKYCDVIVKRWEDFTGKKAHLYNEEQEFEIITQAT